MKVAMISQSMGGRSADEILAERDAAVKVLKQMGYTALHTFFTDEWFQGEKAKEPRIINDSVYFLAESLKSMSLCHAVYFCKGWERARGCRIEHATARDYGLEMIYDEQAERETNVRL